MSAAAPGTSTPTPSGAPPPAAAATPPPPAAAATPPPASTPAAAKPADPPAAPTSLLTPPPTTDPGQKGADAGAKPQDAKPPDGKPGDAAELDVKFPEGFQANAEAVQSFKAVAKELGLKSESAQKLADVYAKAETAKAAAWQSELKGWVESAKADPEYGGAQFDASLGLAKTAMAKFTSPAFQELLGRTGLGNHPEVIRTFVKLGKAMAEDSLAGTKGGAPDGDPKEAIKAEMYPSHSKK